MDGPTLPELPITPQPVVATPLAHSDAASISAASRSPPQTLGKRRSSEPASQQRPERRQKVSRACDACKQRKAKCSGTVPCSACVSRGATCLYETKYGRGRPPTPEPAHVTLAAPAESSPALTNYSGQIGGHDRPLTAASHIPASHAYHVRTLSTSSIRNQGTTNGTATSYAQHPLPTSDRPLDNGNTEPTPLHSRASPEIGITEVHGQYVDPTSGLSFLHRAWKRLSGPQTSRTLATDQAGLDHANGGAEKLQAQMCAGDKPFELDVDDGNSPLPIPDRHTAAELLTLYFDVCIATYRFLHLPSVRGWLDKLQHNVDHSLPLSRGIGEMRASIVLTTLAVAIFHQGKSRSALSADEEFLALRRSDRLFTAGIRLSDAATGYPTLESVQAKLVQVLYLLQSSRMNQAWYVFGHIFQMVSAMGLHRKTSRTRSLVNHAVSADYIDAQCRRRVFWCSYTLDTYLGVLFGRPRHYKDDSIDQEYPDAVNDEDMTWTGPKATKGQHKDCAIDALIFHAKLSRIVAQISERVYVLTPLPKRSLRATVDQLSEQLRQWKEELPPILGSIRPSSLVPPFRRQATVLKLACCHAIMHANRPLLLRDIGPHGEQLFSNTQAVSDCLSTARVVLELVDEMAQEGSLFHAFWWTHYVTFCSLTVVYVWEIQRNAFGRSGDPSPADDLPQLDGLFELAERCQLHLAHATASNSPSRRYSIILEELRQEAICHSPAAATTDYPQPTHTVMNYAGANGSGMEGVVGNVDDAAMPGGDFVAADQQPEMSTNTWDGWQTTDWLDIDSLAFGPFPGFNMPPQSWVAPPPDGFLP